MKNKLWKISLGMATLLCASAFTVALPTINTKAETLDDVNVTLKMGGAGVRMTGEKDEAIRFRAGLTNVEYATLSNYDVEFGMLVIPVSELQGEFSLENDVQGVSIIQVPVNASATYVEGDMTYYNVALSNIPNISYTSDIMARAYVTLSDGENEKTIYSDVQTRNLAYVAYRETLANQNLTDTESSALENYMSGKNFYPISVEEGAGLTLDYDYAFAGQVLNLNWDLDGQYMKTVSINDTLNEDFWSTGKVIMPAEAAVVNSVLRNQTDTPTILGANGGTYWAAGGKEYTISQASEITTCETEQISDADWKALLDAGYKGSIEKGNVTKAVHPTRATMGSANVSFGVALDGLTLVDLFESSAWADVQDRYYISIWLKVNVSGYNWVKTLAAFDVENKKQGYTYLINGVDYANWDTLPQDTWYELRYSLKALRNSAYGVDNGICPNDLSFGLYCYHSNLGSDATFSIYSMELMLNDAETTTSGNVDLSYAVGNPFANNYVKMQGFDIYDGETKLKAGEDYTVDGTTVNGLSAGSYKVQYNLVSSNVWNGALNAYPNGAVITRKLVVEQAYPVVIDDMSTTSSVKAYTQTHAGATFKTNECTEIISQSTTITADEYQALVDLGYKGAKTDLNAQTLTFSSYTARQNVYVQFDKTAVDERLAEVIQNKDDSVYLSIWLKSNQTYGCTTYAGIIGQTSNKVVPHNGAWKDGVAGNWFEIKIAISDLLPTSADIGDGKLSASETYAYGFVMENAHAHQLNQYLNSATFTIYSVELCKA